MYAIYAYIDPQNHPWPDRQSYVFTSLLSISRPFPGLPGLPGPAPTEDATIDPTDVVPILGSTMFAASRRCGGALLLALLRVLKLQGFP